MLKGTLTGVSSGSVFMRSVLVFLVSCFIVLFQAAAQITLNPAPTRVIGQDSLVIDSANPNLVEGREFFDPLAVALDTSTNPAGLYVADTGNNRVLGFRSAVGFANGQKADVVLGQLDFGSTFAQGPGRTGARTTGLASPTGIAVDGTGNVYVVDSGNNRILRFPQPFTQSGTELPDLVIGQPSFSTSGANQGGISAATLSFTTSSSSLVAYLAFDSSGNLWVADAGNNRVLRFNASVLGSQASPGPSADLVLGQVDFVTNSYSPTGNPLTSLSAFIEPTGIAFDAAGRLFVSESVSTQQGRILMWTPPFASGQLAARILGIDNSNPPPSGISQYQFQARSGALFTVGAQIGIADPLENRLLVFPPVEQWTAGTTYQAASQVVGQPDFNSGGVNQGQPGAGPATLALPAAAAFSGTALFVADSANSRVVVLPQSGNGFGPATGVLGQDALNLNGVNLLEGREYDFSAGGDAGIAVDLNSSPPRLYVADTYNNRILGYNDLRNIQPGAKADIVIGQPDFQHSWVNYPSNNGNTPNQSGLAAPTGLLVDSAGNLYVADTANSRVLRFPAPFANYKPGAMEKADLVLGQSGFNFSITDASNRTMAAPYGLAMTLFPGLLVSDVVHNRVLFFPGTSQTFTSGESATIVFGQPDFVSTGAGNGLSQLSAPHHIATDSDDRLYVADTGNARISIFDHAPTSTPGQPAAVALTAGLSQPRGMYVNLLNGDIWVSDAANNAAIRYPAFNQLELTNYAPNAALAEAIPLALTEDPWGDIFIADDANRVVIHYPGLATLNAANFLFQNLLAPGMIGSLYSRGNSGQFGTVSQSATSLPLPTQLNGIEVLFNQAPVPLFYAGTDQINFEVPNLAPQSGTADLQVLEVATGRILGDTTVGMTTALPGLFTQAANGSGALIAANQDGTLNTQMNPAVAGQFITLYGTGEGFIPGGPPDGAAATQAISSPRAPTVFISPHTITGSAIEYAGIAPGQVGVWQINVMIPSDVVTLPTNPVNVIVIQDSVASADIRQGRVVEIYVKQP